MDIKLIFYSFEWQKWASVVPTAVHVHCIVVAH